MGNRAVITFHTNPKGPAVYVHWNGGLASVLGFLQAMRELTSWDDARVETRTQQLHEVCKAYIGSSAYHEAELDRCDQDNWDNGTYVVDPVTLLIKQRLFTRGGEEVDATKTAEIALHCVQAVTSARCDAWFAVDTHGMGYAFGPQGGRKPAAVRAPKGAGKARVLMARTDCLPWFHLDQHLINEQGLLMGARLAA